jgi:hypothetical protein
MADEDIIRVSREAFEAGRTSACHEKMRTFLETSMCPSFTKASRPVRSRAPRKPVEQWKSARPVGKRPLNPMAVVVPKKVVHAVCNKLSDANFGRMRKALVEHADADAEMVVSTIIECLVENGYYLPLFVKAVIELKRKHGGIVGAHVQLMHDDFVRDKQHMLKDDVGSEDYDAFCGFLAEKRKRLTKFEFLHSLGYASEMAELLPEIVILLGDKDTVWSKDMLIDMLGIHYRASKRADASSVKAYELYIGDKQRYGIDTKARFKLIDLVASVKRIVSA